MKILLFFLTLIPYQLAVAGDWFFIEGDDSYPIKNTQEIENQIWKYIDETEEIMLPRDKYNYQYQFLPKKMYVVVQGFCDDLGGLNPSEKFYRIDGGGDCYFRLEFNLLSKSVSEFWVNARR